MVALALLSCDPPNTTPTDASGSATETAPSDARPTGQVAEGYFTTADLEAYGVVVKPVDARRSMVCGPDGELCMCLMPLDCELPGSCVTFEDNVKVFRESLARDAGRTVDCNRAETGHCGKLRYFYFNGDIYRDEVRWFDETGKLVGQRNSTDYAKYCEGWSRSVWEGKIPKCTAMTRDELICGKPGKPLSAAIEDMRKQTAPPDAAIYSQPHPFGFCGRPLPSPNTKKLSCGSSQVTLLTPIAALTKLEELDLSGSRVRDLSPLRNMKRLVKLNLRGTPVTGLSPLSQLTKLKELNLMESSVTDLTPLAELPSLEELVLAGLSVDHSVLKKLKSLKTLSAGNDADVATMGSLTQLVHLELSGKGVKDIGPLAGMTEMRELVLHDTGVKSLLALRGMKKLEMLWVIEGEISDIAPMRGLAALKHLSLQDTPVASLSPLRGAERLEELALSGTEVSDLSPLAALTRLKKLHLQGKMESLTSLASLRDLEVLSISHTKVSDLSPLRHLKKLTSLTISDTRIADLSALAELDKLQYLLMENTPVTNLAPLAKLEELGVLRAKGSKVTDLEPLAGLKKLRDLDVKGAPVRDLTPLARSSLRTLALDEQADPLQIAKLRKARPEMRIYGGPPP